MSEENMFGFDANEVDTELGIKEGEYNAVINTAKKTTTKDSGKTMFVISYKIVGEKYNGKIFDFNNFVISGPTDTGTKLFFKLIEDCGLQKTDIRVPADLAKLIGKPICIVVGKKKNKEGVEEKYSSVLYTKKSEVEAPKEEF